MTVLDTFYYSFKPKDEGVSKKLDEITKKSDGVKSANKGVSDSFKDFSDTAKSSLGSIIPGADGAIHALEKLTKAWKSARDAAEEAKAKAKSKSKSGSRGGSDDDDGERVSNKRRRRGRGTGGGGKGPGAAEAAAEGGEGMAEAGLGMAAAGAAISIVAVAAAAKFLTDAFVEGAKDLTNSRKQAQEAGINNLQMAGAEQYAKSLKLNKADMQSALITIAKTTQAGWVTSRTFGNIWGIGNEQTQMLKKHGIATSSHGQLRNASAIMDDITRKMIKMPRASAIAFGQFFGMTKDMATAIKDSGQTLGEYTAAHRKEIEAQAKGIDNARAYEKAQQNLSNVWDDFRIKMATTFMPMMTSLINITASAVRGLGELGVAIHDMSSSALDAAGKMLLLHKTSNEEKLATANDDIAQYKRDAKLPANATDAQLIASIHGGASGGNSADLIMGALKRRDESQAGAWFEKVQKDTKTDDTMRKANQQVSENAKAASTQLEAANLMKVATARFGLSTEQYMAIWAADSGKGGGMRSSGGTTTSDFRDIYKSAYGKFGNPEVMEAMYMRGAPMMAALPAQYAMGLGVTPMGIPAHPQGLLDAKNAVNNSDFNVGPAGGPGGGAPVKPTSIEIKTGPITIQTNSSDPDAINTAIAGHLVSQIKMALNKNNDGQVA